MIVRMGEAIITLTRAGSGAEQVRTESRWPGIALLGAVAGAGALADRGMAELGERTGWGLPHGESVLWAILIGLIVANTGGVARVFRAGLRTYEWWLKLGIMLMGARFVVGDVLRLGGMSLACVAVELGLAIGVMTLLGRWFGLPEKMTSLLAIGSCICGVTAIFAAKDSIEAEEEDASCAVAAILALGITALVAFPLIGHWLGLSDRVFGMWSGLAIDNTAEATAAGALYSEAAGRYAVLAKTARSAALGFVVLGYAMHWARRRGAAVRNKAGFVWEKLPKFVLGFVGLSVLATAGAIGPGEAAALAEGSRWAFLLAFAAVGLRTNVGELRRQGVKPLAVGVAGEIVIATATLGMVAWAAR